MKKLKKVIAGAMALTISAASMGAVSAEEYAKGDVDMDGEVTGRDAAIVSQYADGILQMELNDEQLALADMDRDGSITAEDAALIAEIQTREYCDVDGNGYTDITDSTFLLCRLFREAVNKIELVFDMSEYSEYETMSDVNLDGKIDRDDVIISFYYHVDKIAEFPFFDEGKFYCIKTPNYSEKNFGNFGDMTFDEWYEDFMNRSIIRYFDINDDRKLSIDDASAVLAQYADRMAGKGIYKAADEENSYDVNGDGVVDIADTSLLLKIYAYNAAGLL